MRILVISDLHGDFTLAEKACRELRPDLLISCGDWGDPDQVSARELERFLDLCTTWTTFGNHDPLALLGSATNRDGSAVLLGQGEVRDKNGLRLAAIGGIWAKSYRMTHYVTDQDVAGWAKQIAQEGPIDVLLTHACAVGLADLTPSGRHGGQRCFLEAQKTISPRLHLCGHLHVAQEKTLRDGRKIINVGTTPEGSVVLVQFDPAARTLRSHLSSVNKGPLHWPDDAKN
ncbi:MAG: metallophosphoesterase family protein [Isosphaeraceae bacterium]